MNQSRPKSLFRAGLRGGAAGVALLLSIVAVIGVGSCAKQPAALKIKPPRDLTTTDPGAMGKGGTAGAVSATEAKETSTVPLLTQAFAKKGESLVFKAVAYDKNDVFMEVAKVRWESSDPGVAQVDERGTISAQGSGTATITARTTEYAQELVASLRVQAVIIDRVQIVAPQGAETLRLGETKQLRADVFDDRGNLIPDAKLRWRTQEWAAGVSTSGEVEGLALGEGTVIAQAGDKAAQYRVKVLDRPGR